MLIVPAVRSISWRQNIKNRQSEKIKNKGIAAQ